MTDHPLTYGEQAALNAADQLLEELELVDDPYAGQESTTEIATLDPAGDIATAENKIRNWLGEIGSRFLDIGRELRRVKGMIGHGQFGQWLDDNFGMSESSALRLMRAAEFVEGKSVKLTDLSKSALYQLAAPSTPQAAVEVVEKRLEAGESLTAKQVEAIIEDAGKPKPKAKPRAKAPAEPEPSAPVSVEPEQIAELIASSVTAMPGTRAPDPLASFGDKWRGRMDPAFLHDAEGFAALPVASLIEALRAAPAKAA